MDTSKQQRLPGWPTLDSLYPTRVRMPHKQLPRTPHKQHPPEQHLRLIHAGYERAAPQHRLQAGRGHEAQLAGTVAAVAQMQKDGTGPHVPGARWHRAACARCNAHCLPPHSSAGTCSCQNETPTSATTDLHKPSKTTPFSPYFHPKPMHRPAQSWWPPPA